MFALRGSATLVLKPARVTLGDSLTLTVTAGLLLLSWGGNEYDWLSATILGLGGLAALSLILLAQTLGWLVTLIALVVNLVLVVLAFAYSEWLGRKISPTGLRAISKIISLLLAAIAVNMIRRGLGG